jgi:tether containing UBX domain for GLUT4
MTTTRAEERSELSCAGDEISTDLAMAAGEGRGSRAVSRGRCRSFAKHGQERSAGFGGGGASAFVTDRWPCRLRARSFLNTSARKHTRVHTRVHTRPTHRYLALLIRRDVDGGSWLARAICISASKRPSYSTSSTSCSSSSTATPPSARTVGPAGTRAPSSLPTLRLSSSPRTACTASSGPHNVARRCIQLVREDGPHTHHARQAPVRGAGRGLPEVWRQQGPVHAQVGGGGAHRPRRLTGCRYNNKPLSLSQQIRLANLPSGARLELVQSSRSPTVISVALQLPKSRLTQKFASNTSLWEIIRYFESANGANYNFTQRGVPEMSGDSGAGRLHYETPVITVMPSHREQSDFVGLQQTLAQLGFDSGSALLKLSFKNSGIPLEEAIAQITQYFKSEEPAGTSAEGAHAATSAQSASKPDLEQAAPETISTVAGETIRSEEPDPETMDIDTSQVAKSEPEVPAEGATVENVGDLSPADTAAAATSTASATSMASAVPDASAPDISSYSQRNVQIYGAPKSSTPQAAQKSFNESDYNPTVEHAKAHQAHLLTRTRNTRLLSDKELEEQDRAQQEKMETAAAKGAIVRVRMPDGELIQFDIFKTDTAAWLHDFVKTFLDNKNEPFELKHIGPRAAYIPIEKNDKCLIQHLRFSANELVRFSWANNASAAVRASRDTLSDETQASARELKIEDPVAAEKAPASSSNGETVADGKKKSTLTAEEKESKLRKMLGGKKLFNRKG